MASKKTILHCFVAIFSIYISLLNVGCANIGFPTGGPRDSLPPILIKANPSANSLLVKDNKIELIFDEYVDIQNVQQNVLVSPFPNESPKILSKLKTVTVKLMDSLQANTTYSINFGDAIKDVNENNIFKNFTYSFSTGSYIDSLQIEGSLLKAETGLTDSTMQILLYKNANDTSVSTRKPDYIAKLNGSGKFKFVNLPAAEYKVYAIKDADGSRTYNSKYELFAFSDSDKTFILTKDTIPNINLYAYSEQVKIEQTPNTGNNVKKDKAKKIQYSSSIKAGQQDLLNPLTIVFSDSVKNINADNFFITDTNYTRIANVEFENTDTLKKSYSLKTNWQPETDYILILKKGEIIDTAKNTLVKTDTIRFKTNRTEDYGKVVIKFKNMNLKNNPVLQILENNEIIKSYALATNEWSQEMFAPGEYNLRILYDTNTKNEKWDPGNFLKRQQPEIVKMLLKKLSVKANWENESEIEL